MGTGKNSLSRTLASGWVQRMSRISSFDFTPYRPIRSPLEIVSLLLESGWTLDCNGDVSYLPLGDAGLFDWQHVPIEEQNKVFEEIRRKELQGELISLSMFWKDTLIGGEFLFSPKGDLAFIATAKRKTIQNCDRYTDVTWYLQRLIPPLRSGGLSFETIKWGEY